ncbi:hypothetical protein JCM19294_1819 [Nonlabens tegetincola]|uniref:Uncharacterized protein n=1 Tax=Nonlabens tegetincola TaxID=323273 RepID=A0A090QLA7_9FLAO|nr:MULTISPECIES: DUF6452 family protein [Nonlabens]ALM21570.1 hypothetical protein AAT17_10160 [Nonlabens sp. MIC269]ARN71703.1 hypothetical protein BST91_08640 [Nonlabens tegetincola]PQJ14212.1 hypothetical protein BST93_13295 [Nonlabens tegetincola]GAK96306.1 hypothetical protein JCM19294_1819 [Nonlabens tegetincola]
MSKFKATFILIWAIFFLVSGCEKDDLCTLDQPANARINIVFKDRSIPSDNKVVSQLRVLLENVDTEVPLNSTNDLLLTATDSISIPLPIDVNTVTYRFERIENENENQDAITFTFDTREEYVSRACGFRVVYDNLTAQVAPETGTNNWINSVVVNETTIEDNQIIHVEIRH